MSPNIPKIPTDTEIIADLSFAYQRREEYPLSGVMVRGQTCVGAELRGLSTENSVFDRCRLSESNLTSAMFSDVLFDNCDFSNCHLEGACFLRCEFVGCKFLGAYLNESDWRDVTVTDCVMQYANFASARLHTVVMRNCDLGEAAFTTVKPTLWSMKGCRLRRTNFYKTPLRGMDLSGNELTGILVSEGVTELRGTTMSTEQLDVIAGLLQISLV